MADFDDFLKGQKDCIEGKECDENSNENYKRGYAAQYELEQVKDALCQ